MAAAIEASTSNSATTPKGKGNIYDEEVRQLVEAGLMHLPMAELTEDFWQMPAPEVSTEAILAAIQADREG